MEKASVYFGDKKSPFRLYMDKTGLFFMNKKKCLGVLPKKIDNLGVFFPETSSVEFPFKGIVKTMKGGAANEEFLDDYGERLVVVLKKIKKDLKKGKVDGDELMYLVALLDEYAKNVSSMKLSGDKKVLLGWLKELGEIKDILGINEYLTDQPVGEMINDVVFGENGYFLT